MESPENRVPVPSGRLEAAVVDDSFEAGHVNTARLIIKNPFDVPVKILAVVPPKASTLRDLESPRWFEKEKIADHDGAAHKPVETSNRWLKNIFPFLGDQFGFGSPEIQFGDVSGSLQSASIEIAAAENSKVTIDQPLPRFSRLNISSKPGSEITIAGQPAESLSDRSDPVQIGPHCEVVQHFPFETRGWLLFKPTKVNISVQIRYQVSSEERDQVVSASLDVKPPLSSMVVGSLAGAILGTLAKTSTQSISLDAKGWFVTFFSSIVMSLIATILLSRKTGAQGFITVEDFFGAFVVGTLIGYTGSNYLVPL